MISSTLKWVALAVLSALPVVMLGAFTDVSWQTLGSERMGSADARRSVNGYPALPEPEPQLVKPLTPEQAVAANDALPFVANAVERASSFGLGETLSDPLHYSSAYEQVMNRGGHRCYTVDRRNRSALPITDTELRLIARAASIGDISQPVNG